MSNKLPDYINCNRKGITDCDYLVTDLCPNTCDYAKNVMGKKTEKKSLLSICEFFPCVTARETKRDCSGGSFEGCHSRKLLKEYGETHLGIGAPVIPIGRAVEKGIDDEVKDE